MKHSDSHKVPGKLVFLRALLVSLSVITVAACSFLGINNQDQNSTAARYYFANDGRDLNAPYLNTIYTLDKAQALSNVTLAAQCDLRTALQRQRNYLLKKTQSDIQHVDSLAFSRADQLAVVERIERWLDQPMAPFPAFNAYKISGKDNLGNVQFTGYFSPKLRVRQQPNQQYRYPIYAMPSSPQVERVDGKLPARDEIDCQGALSGLGLELAYADNLVDLFFLQIQGSGVVEFIDTGEVATFAYAGKNGHGYYSIGRYLVEQGYLSPAEVSLETIKTWLSANPSQQREVLALNPSYVFFTKTQRLPTGASGQPVTGYCSIAVDPEYIPYGSTVLIKRPVLDSAGNLTHHQTSVFFAQDRGGAIKGPGRVDIYMGIGDEAKRAASALKHYGALWLLLPEQQ